MTARVSIGLPVYNGQRYLGESIESILGQTYGDFELLIFDNASTDRTADICRSYARVDPRISYVRNPENIGSARNFNMAFERASGEYFKWAADDDVCAPELLERCVEVLDRDPSVILGYPKVAVIDEDGRYLGNYDFVLDGTHEKPHKRFARQIVGHQCYEVFGLFRAAALRETRLIGNYAGGDAAMLLRLCLLGRFEEIPEVLFYSRAHAGQSTALRRNARVFSVWFDPKWKGKIIFPYWRLLGEYTRIVRTAALPWTERVMCSLYVANWARLRTRHLARDLRSAGMQLVGGPRRESCAQPQE